MFVLIACTYFYFFQGSDPNQTSRYMLTRALVERHAPDITPDHPLTIDKSEWRGKFYSDKAPGVSFLAVVPYAAFHALDRIGGVDESARSAYRARLHALVFLLSGLAGVLATAFLRRCLLLLGAPERHANLLAIGYALGTLAFPFSTVLFGHQTAAALLIATFTLCIGERASPSPRPRAFRLALGAAWGMCLIVEYPTAIGVAVLGLYFLSGEPGGARGRATSFVWVALGALPLLALHSAFLAWAFGSPFDLAYNHVVDPIFRAHTTSGLLGIGRPRASVLFELLLGRYRGLLFYCPFLAFAVAGYGAWIRRGERAAEGLVCALVPAAALAINAGYYAWDGGFSTGPRHLVPSLPFLVVPIAWWMRSRWREYAVGAAVAASVVVMYACTAVRVQLPEGDPRHMNDLYAIVVPALVRGEVSINHSDLFASTWQHDAAYNLGTLFGLGARASLLVPLLLWALAYARELRAFVSRAASRREGAAAAAS